MALHCEPFTAGEFISSGIVRIGGEEIPYNTVCRDYVMHNDEGKPIGSIFSYSYFRSDVDNNTRPVIFFFNGGPGSGSLWLNAGLFGPLRVKYENADAVNVPSTAPYRVEENELCLLDICDLVMIDPVGTGYGRLLDKEAGDQFFGLDADADSLNSFIHSWLGRYDRWQSPKYLLGESYGTIRAAILAESLSGSSKSEFSAVGLDGIVMLGNAIGESDSILQFSAEPIALALPSMASAYWYHSGQKGNRVDFVNECYDFCANELVGALFLGGSIGEGLKKQIASKISYFTGLDEAYIIEQDLRPKMEDYLKRIIKDKGCEIGLYDGRFSLPINKDYDRKTMFRDDPAISRYTPSFMAAMCGPIKKSLNISFDRKYYAISQTVGEKWKWESERSAAKSLAASMRRNPELRVMFATGCYDMICQMGEARYLVNHIGLPLDRVELREYPSGHMAYLGEESASAFANDVRAFVEKNEK